METMLVGGPYGFGKDIVDRFNAHQYSRSCGYDIDDYSDAQLIAEYSTLFDNVIIHAYTPNGGQLRILELIAERWAEIDHKGHIIVTGSVASHFDFYKPETQNMRYAANKAAIDKFCKLLSKKCIEGLYPFKITVIKPGMLDTEKSRSKKHFTKGITGQTFCDTLEFILNLPNDVIIPELVLETIYEDNQ